MAKNIWSKTRPKTNPYFTMTVGTWTWRILKAYQSRKGEKTNKFARLLCDVASPMTAPGSDMGDTYISDIPLTPEFAEALKKREAEEDLL